MKKVRRKKACTGFYCIQAWELGVAGMLLKFVQSFYNWDFVFLLIAAICCSACVKIPVTETVFVRQAVPQILLVPVEQPVFTGDTNGDLADYALSLEEALSVCNGKLKAMEQ